MDNQRHTARTALNNTPVPCIYFVIFLFLIFLIFPLLLVYFKHIHVLHNAYMSYFL